MTGTDLKPGREKMANNGCQLHTQEGHQAHTERDIDPKEYKEKESTMLVRL